MNFTEIDFSQAWIRHSMFKTRLRAYLLSGTGDTDTLTNPGKCSLGEWLKEIVLKYSLQAASVMEVSYLHEAVHSTAARLISLYRQKQEDQARAGLEELEALDQELLEALNGLEKEVA